MANKDIQPRWEQGESGNPNGRPKGSKNRSTIARKWLEVNQSLKNPITGEQETMSQPAPRRASTFSTARFELAFMA